MKKVVYITGCTGFIGSYITLACLKKGWFVRGIDKMTYASNEDILENFMSYPNFSFEKKDINDLDIIFDCDYVINTAAETHVDNSIVKSSEFIHSNINGVHHLLELIKSKSNFKMPTFLHFSTDEVYGDIASGFHKETDILNPSNPYSATKAAADMLILAWARTYKIPFIVVRPTNNYGERQYVEKLIPKTCKYLSLDRRIPLHNNGTPIRTWLHAADTAEAIITIIESGIQNEIFNISGGFEQSNIETVSMIIRHWYDGKVNVNDHIDFSYNREGQDVRYSIDDFKLKRLGWKPTLNFDVQLPNIIHYYRNTFIW